MATKYTKNIPADLPNGINHTKLSDEIKILLPTFTHIQPGGDSQHIWFSSSLSVEDQTTLSTTCTNHVLAGGLESVELFRSTGFDVVHGKDSHGKLVEYIGEQTNEIHISKETQGQYSSLKAALDANTAENLVFIIHPGIYVEDNPLLLKSGCTVKSTGNAETTIIIANNVNSDIISATQMNSIVGLTIQGATGIGARGIYFNGSLSGGLGKFTAVTQCFIKDCDIAIESDGKDGVGSVDTLYCRETIIYPLTGVRSKGVYCHSGGQFISAGVSVSGIPVPYVPILNALMCVGVGSKISMTTSNVLYCVNGLTVDDDGEVEMVLISLRINTNAIIIGSAGTSSRLNISMANIRDSTVSDLDIRPSSAQIEIHSGLIDETKIINPNCVKIAAKFHTVQNGRYYQGFTGDVHIGNPLEPSKLDIGSGQYDFDNAIVLSNDNLEAGTWVDNSTHAASYSGSTLDMFPGVSVGQCCYIGQLHDCIGCKIEVTTAATSNITFDDITWEYWNGTIWMKFDIMQSGAIAPKYSIVNSIVNTVGKYQVRYGLKSDAPLALYTLNGFERKWVRVRIVNTLPSVITLEYIKPHTHHTEIGKTGFIEYYGDARPVTTLDLKIHDIVDSNANAGTQELFLAKNLSVSRIKNVFTAATLCRLGLTSFIPMNIDTSFPIKLCVSYIVDNDTAGDIEWKLRWACSELDSNIYRNSTDAPTDAPNVNLTTNIMSIPATKKDTERRSEFLITVQKMGVNLQGSPPHQLWISLERNAGVSSDTYTGSVSLIQVHCKIVTWSEGCHLLTY
jgi:hypothetical protein